MNFGSEFCFICSAFFFSLLILYKCTFFHSFWLSSSPSLSLFVHPGEKHLAYLRFPDRISSKFTEKPPFRHFFGVFRIIFLSHKGNLFFSFLLCICAEKKNPPATTSFALKSEMKIIFYRELIANETIFMVTVLMLARLAGLNL